MKITNSTIIIFSIIVTLVTTCAVYGASYKQRVSLSVTAEIAGTIKSAAPEKRAGAQGTNWDTNFYITVRTPDDTDDSILFTMTNLASTNELGRYLTPISFGELTPGPYDVTFKGHQHLTKKLNNINLISGNNILNFTQANNSIATGTVELIAGDISGDGLTVATLGDDVINSVDLGIMLNGLDNDDPTGNTIRANLNQDIVVNSVDLSVLINNLDLEGDN